MTNSINTYDDLLREKQRLTFLLEAQKEIVRQDVLEIKEELAPIKSAISMVGKLVTKDNSNLLLTTAADKLIDVVIKKVVLARAGWISKLILPFVMKNFSSHVIADNKDQILGKLFSWIGKKKHQNGQAHPVEPETGED